MWMYQTWTSVGKLLATLTQMNCFFRPNVVISTMCCNRNINRHARPNERFEVVHRAVCASKVTFCLLNVKTTAYCILIIPDLSSLLLLKGRIHLSITQRKSYSKNVWDAQHIILLSTIICGLCRSCSILSFLLHYIDSDGACQPYANCPGLNSSKISTPQRWFLFVFYSTQVQDLFCIVSALTPWALYCSDVVKNPLFGKLQYQSNWTRRSVTIPLY